MTKVSASKIKEWSTSNISPLAWSRITNRSSQILDQQGYTLKEVEKASVHISLEGKALESIVRSAQELYSTIIPDSILHDHA